MEQVEFTSDLLDIDPNELDQEWLNQPRHFYRYAKMLEKLRKTHEQLKAKFKLVAATCGKEIRQDAQKKKQKPTEAAIINAMLLMEEYQEAEKAVIEASYQVGVYEAVVKSLAQRKDALENLVRLHGQNYFSKPQMNTDNKERMTDLRMRQQAMKRNSGR